MIFLSLFRACNFHSDIFWVVHFPFWYYHFPGCDFSVIFKGVQFPFWHFPGCAFSILANSNCAFYVIFWGVTFLSFSILAFSRCGFLSSGVYIFCHFPGCAFSILVFSRSCISILAVSRLCNFHQPPADLFATSLV